MNDANIMPMKEVLYQNMEIRYYQAGEAAKILGVCPTMVHRWLNTGILIETTGVRGPIRLIDAGSVEKLKRERELNPPKRGRKPKDN